jgi:hypothetical protein
MPISLTFVRAVVPRFKLNSAEVVLRFLRVDHCLFNGRLLSLFACSTP